VGRLDHRFGRNTIIAVATGSTARDIIDRKLQEVPTYGVLAGTSSDYLRKLFDELVRAGAIAVTADQYAVVSLTPHGREVAWRRVSVELHWPVLTMAEPAEAVFAPTAFRRRGKKKSSKLRPPSAGRIFSSGEDAVFNTLKEWRKGEAELREVPAYCIFSDSTLRAIAIEKPRTLQSLAGISGLGPVKLEAYGDAVLKIITLGATLDAS